MRVGVVGCGLMGRRRAEVVAKAVDDELIIVADTVAERASALAQEFDCVWAQDWKAIFRHGLDILVVCTPNKFLLPVTVEALSRGCHVLCEKPLGRNAHEAQEMVDMARDARCLLKVGFNLRYHLAIMLARTELMADHIGSIMYLRAVYGHGGRPGYDKEWRGDPDLAGGGELLDQGVHLVDLARWFMGDFNDVFGMTSTSYWDGLGIRDEVDGSTRQLEDNAFVLLRTCDNRVAQLHTSWTQWKNRFSLELFGDAGYLIVNGLGGSYGTEELIIGKDASSGLRMETKIEFPGPDQSFVEEWGDFRRCIDLGLAPWGSGEDGLAAMRIIGAVYDSQRLGRVVKL